MQCCRPSLVWSRSWCAIRSNSASKVRAPYGTGEVASPHGVTYNATFHQWFSSGASFSRVLPTICVHMCSVSRVLSHSEYGSGGQSKSVMSQIIRTLRPPRVYDRLPSQGVLMRLSIAFLAACFPMLAQLDGTVSSVADGPMEGVLVSAKKADSP